MMRSPLLLLVVSILLLPGLVGAIQDADSTAHVVQPGDTWTALAHRYASTTSDLQALSGYINTARQPAIGSTVPIPANLPEITGSIVRSNHGGLLETAAAHNVSPWSLALANQQSSPFRPVLWQAIVVPGEQPIRELPVGASKLTLTPDTPVPGQALAAHLVLESAEQPTAVSLDGQAFAVTNLEPDVLAISGTGAFTDFGEHEFSVKVGEAPVWRQPWLLTEREWIFQQLTLSGEAAEIDQAAIEAERERLSSFWSQVSPRPLWSAPFQTPIADFLEISAEYGARRSYNGGPYRSYHEGVDFSAYQGTPVTAAASGTVVLAEPLFVRGGTVLIDHGLGVYTGYYHLSEILVEAGQSVQMGEQVGGVGTSGLSTGNHLHWDLIVNGVWVDAQRWQEDGTACWLLQAVGAVCAGTG